MKTLNRTPAALALVLACGAMPATAGTGNGLNWNGTVANLGSPNSASLNGGGKNGAGENGSSTQGRSLNGSNQPVAPRFVIVSVELPAESRGAAP